MRLSDTVTNNNIAGECFVISTIPYGGPNLFQTAVFRQRFAFLAGLQRPTFTDGPSLFIDVAD
jgi:hypothetical protein